MKVLKYVKVAPSSPSLMISFLEFAISMTHLNKIQCHLSTLHNKHTVISKSCNPSYHYHSRKHELEYLVLNILISGIQTEGGPQLSDQHDHWRAAMEHNKQVLASQETEMKEYLRRQQRVAEKHIKQFSPALPRKNGIAHQTGNFL